MFARLPILFGLSIGLLMGCGSGPKTLRVGIEAERGANNDAPVAIAILAVYDTAVFAELSKLSATEWFKQAEQRRRDNPEDVAFEVFSREVMPGQRLKEHQVKLSGRPAQGIVYADYFTPGNHRARFSPSKRILIVLGSDDLTVIDLEDD